jgi:hypothetical protein
MVSGMIAIDIFFNQNLFNIDCLKNIKSCNFSESYFSYELNMNLTTTNFCIKGHFKIETVIYVIRSNFIFR